MKWDPQELVKDFQTVAELAHTPIHEGAIQIEVLRKPHAPPRLRKGTMGVYVFSDRDRVLKVGKAGANSGARFSSQHYTGSAPSTLRGSLLADPTMVTRHGLDAPTVSDWIRDNTDRVNFILDAKAGPFVLALLETFVQCRLRPVYEGRSNPN